MKYNARIISLLLAILLLAGLCACGSASSETAASDADTSSNSESLSTQDKETGNPTDTESRKEAIESALDLTNIGASWTYSENADAWTMESVTAVTNAELPDYQGVSICVPAAYVKGIDTNGDGSADVTSGTASGSLVIDYGATVTSTNGQLYTAATAPVIINTGAAGYSAQANQTAGTAYAADGYINVACGNRGKQSTLSDGTYTGDAPSCLVDQKNAVRFVKYNILLGNLPGNTDAFVSTGGSGGGAHATMLAATSNNPDFYPYEAAAGAVGVYANDDGTYSTSVSINGQEVELSDGIWGCMAYSAITSLAEADMTLAFEYYLDSSYNFNTAFQQQLAAYLAEEYMEYINSKELTVEEEAVGFDLNEDGSIFGTVALTIEYDAGGHSDTNGYYGSYLDLYLAEFEQSLQAYIDRLAYADDWTWFDADGNVLTDAEVASMTDIERAEAFLNGWYSKGSTGSAGSAAGGPGGNHTGGDHAGGPPSGDLPDGAGPDDDFTGSFPDGESDATEAVGTPDAGTTQSASSGTDSTNYGSFEELLAAYEVDIAEIESGDVYGNNIVELYDPLNYIGAEGTEGPAWARILSGASEGDISMFNSLNIQIAWLNAGTDADIEWQWNGGHVPSEIFGDSLALYVDTMYGKYVEGAIEISKAAATGQTKNGSADAATGTDLSDWVSIDTDGSLSMTLSGAAAYRTSGASKATPGFDVMDYGQEDYVFGSSTADARHWDRIVLKVLQEHAESLSSLFNK